MKVTAIVPAYNEEKNILSCINSLLSQKASIDEVIVVDDASSDATRDIILKVKDSKVRVVLNDRNRGRPYSLNKAVEDSTGDILAIVDADCRLSIDWLEKGLEKLKTFDAVSGPYKVPPDRGSVQVGHQIVNDFFSSKIHSNLITGGNLIIKREILSSVDGFDEASPYGEDYNLSRKLLKRGANVYYGPDTAIVSEGEPASIEDIIRQRLTQGSTLRYSLREYGLSKGTAARFIYVLTFFFGFIYSPFWLITAIPLIILLIYGLKNNDKYTTNGILIAPFIGLLRTTATFFGFLIGKPKKWRQKE